MSGSAICSLRLLHVLVFLGTVLLVTLPLRLGVEQRWSLERKASSSPYQLMFKPCRRSRLEKTSVKAIAGDVETRPVHASKTHDSTYEVKKVL